MPNAKDSIYCRIQIEAGALEVWHTTANVCIECTTFSFMYVRCACYVVRCCIVFGYAFSLLLRHSLYLLLHQWIGLFTFLFYLSERHFASLMLSTYIGIQLRFVGLAKTIHDEMARSPVCKCVCESFYFLRTTPVFWTIFADICYMWSKNKYNSFIVRSSEAGILSMLVQIAVQFEMTYIVSRSKGGDKRILYIILVGACVWNVFFYNIQQHTRHNKHGKNTGEC